MPTKRLSMRRIHRLMTLRFGAGAATREISRELGISHSTVREYLSRIAAAGISWPLPAEVTDEELERQLFVNGGARAGARHYVEPDWAVARELKRPGVNLMILWEEYRAVHADGYAYSSYVAAVLMLRLVARARDAVGNPGSIRNIEIAYKAFRNATNDGRERRSGRAFSPLRSTLASALAFISRSTSA
jgi:hypothetical protein